MFSEKPFQIALIISLIIHGVVFVQNPNFQLFNKKDKKNEKMEVRYIKPPEEKKAKPVQAPKPALLKKDAFARLPSKITLEDRTPPPFVDKDSVFDKVKNSGPKDASFIKPAFIKPDVIAVKKKVTLPPLDIDKINNQAYIGYYQMVREKIRRAAYQNYARTDIGEVFLSFVIAQDGALKEVRLSEEKSSSEPYLRDIALRSIKDASPFPTFPKELDYPQLSFNIIISFEVDQ